jgi:hypothetical protein
MKIRQITAATAAIGTIAALPANAAELNLNDINQYSSKDQVTNVSQLSDIRPTDWAYGALNKLVTQYGCVAGYPNGTFAGQSSMTRYEAAALLNSCLDRVTEVTDELIHLQDEFAQELLILNSRVSRLENKVGKLEATQFSTTTKLHGDTRWVIGGLSYSDSTKNTREAVSFNYDVRLNFDTSFTGKDLLRTQLRAGNFKDSGFGAAPTQLTRLDAGFEENLGNADGGDVVAINRLYYKVPLSKDVTLVAGPRLRQDDALPVWPSVYTSDKILKVFQYAGAPGAYNQVLGGGAGAWYRHKEWSLGAAYVAGNADVGDPSQGGIANANSASSSTVQIAYTKSNWNITGAYNYSNYGVTNAGTSYEVSMLPNSITGGQTNSFSLAGYWQPLRNSWIPSISAGWGYNTMGYQNSPNVTSQSWYTGLVWKDVIAKSNSLGIAVGQPTFVTKVDDNSANDGQYAFEGYYKIKVSDNISVTPAVFYLSAPRGQLDKSLNTFGGLVQTTFKF